MSRASRKYLLSLLVFGSNGIIASQISLPSWQIVLLRTLLGGTLLALIVLGARKRPAFSTIRATPPFLLRPAPPWAWAGSSSLRHTDSLAWALRRSPTTAGQSS